jgi:hypothetical protein
VSRRFPPPWLSEGIGAAYVVKDTNALIEILSVSFQH